MHQNPLALRKPPGEVHRLSRVPLFAPRGQSWWGWVVMVHGLDLQSLHFQDPDYQGAKLPQKLFSLSVPVMEWSAFPNKAYKNKATMSWDTFLPCLWPFTAGGGKEQRLVGTRVILSAPLGFVPQKTLVCGRNTENQLSKGARGTHCRWGQSSLHKMSTALCKLSWNTGQRQTCLSPCLFQCFIRSFTLLENTQRVRAAFGVEQNCTTPAISHTSMPVYRRGASGPVVSKKLILKDYCFILSILRSRVKKTPNVGNQVNEFSAKPAISARTTTKCYTQFQISLSLDNQVIAPSLNSAAHFHLGRTWTTIPI